MSADNCKTCRCYLDIGGPLGVCRRFPQYQNRSPNEWCGEFVAKKQLLELPVVDIPQVDKKRPGRPKKEVKDVSSSE